MSPLGPLLLTLLLPVTAWSVEYQRLTFSDGSVKTGYFDERKGTLTLDDGSTIAVRLDDIIRRETVSPEGKKLHIPPIPEPPPPANDRPPRSGDPDGRARGK